jgi:hypothetical protein
VKKAKKKREKVLKSEKNWLEFHFALFHFEAKLLNRSEAKNLKRKKVKKAQKMRKNRLEFCFPLFRFEAKITQVKRNEKFEAKISEKKRKREVTFYSEIVKHLWNGSKFALFCL